MNISKTIFFCTAILLTLFFQQNLFARDARFRVPINGTYTVQCILNSACASTSGGKHAGIDYAAANKDILAAADGKVVKLVANGNNDHGLGNTIIIEHKILNLEGGIETLYSQYSHLAGFIPGLYEGQTVVKGLKIGTMGGTGHGGIEWSVHLHFEIKREPVISNPIGGNACGGGNDPCWGYTPTNAENYGYIDPIWLINSSITAFGNNYAYWDFKDNNNLQGWLPYNYDGWAVGGGFLYLDPNGADPFITSPDIFIDASVLPYVEVKMASNAPDGNGYVYFKTETENDYNEDKRVHFDVSNCANCNDNASFEDYSIPMGGHPKWNGKITGIRIDPANNGSSNTNNDLIKFDSIRLAPQVATSIILDPTFSSSASAAPTNPKANQPMTVSADFTNTGGSGSDSIVDVEIYDSAGVKVHQLVFEHQSIPNQGSANYSVDWTPPTNGVYTVKTAIFSNNWTRNYHWNDNALTFNVGIDQPPPSSNYQIDIWWITDGATVSGTQPFKALVQNTSLSQYNMYWQVDGGGLVLMNNSTDGGDHKEAMVDLSGWNWRGSGPYTINFVAKDLNGNILAQNSANIYVVP